MSSFILKIIAMTTMFLDHLSYVVYGANTTTFLNCLGRFAMIIFCFQIVLGFKKTKNIKKYILRLLIIALISQIPYHLLFQSLGFSKSLNVDFTLLLGLISLIIINIHKNKEGKLSIQGKNKIIENLSLKSIGVLTIKVIIIWLLCYTTIQIKPLFGYCLEYSYKAILFIIAISLFYPFEKDKKMIKTILYLLSIIIFGFVEAQMWFGQKGLLLPAFYTTKDALDYVLIYIFTIVGGLLPLLYNGKKGTDIQWFTYLFYPVHLLVVYLIYLLII